MLTRSLESVEPIASILFLAFNQEQTVEAAARSVLNQQINAPIEIILSDDASSDATLEILQRLAREYKGPHQVWVRSNEVNLGIGQHYNVLVANARGPLLITAAGDDISLPNRVERILQTWEQTGQRADLIASYLLDLDHDGVVGKLIQVDDLAKWQSATDWARARPYIVGAAQAFTRRLWSRFGPMSADVVYEDQIITLRAILSGGAVTICEPLVQYRRGGASAQGGLESAESYLARLRVLNARSLSEQTQQLNDARLVGAHDLIRQGLRIFLAREKLVAALLRDATLRAWQDVREAAQTLPLFWCLRKWIYIRWPALAATSNQFQSRRRNFLQRMKATSSVG